MLVTTRDPGGRQASRGRTFAYGCPWHRLYFFPLPHEHGSFGPALSTVGAGLERALLDFKLGAGAPTGRVDRALGWNFLWNVAQLPTARTQNAFRLIPCASASSTAS